MVRYAVLVLNKNFEPLNVCNTQRAIVLVWQGKAEILENGLGMITSPSLSLPLPSVIRLQHLIHRPWHQRKLTRHEIFIRDSYTCQYCGRQTYDLTLDHVIPRHRGGEHVWENVTSACKACNYRKAGHTPEEVGMKLLRKPWRPYLGIYGLAYPHLENRTEWRKYISGWVS